MRELTVEESALVSGGDGICVNVDGNRIALGLGMVGTGAAFLSAAELALVGAGTIMSGGTVLIVGGTALLLGAGGGLTMGSGITITSCKAGEDGGS